MGKRLHAKIYQLIKKESEIPNERNTGIIIPIHKKEYKEICKNYRPITLLNTIYKIIANIINNSLKSLAEKILGYYQNDFRSGKSKIMVILLNRKSFKYNWEFHVICRYFWNAVDISIKPKVLDELMRLGIPKKKLLKLTLKVTKGKVKFQGWIIAEFNINQGVK